jgi:hypothetical protein
MSHAEQLLEIATEAMDAKDEAAALQRHLAKLETRKLDSDGDAMTSCAVIAVDAATQKPSRSARLPKAAQIALRALAEALSECGCGAPASGHIPGSTRVVTLEQWSVSPRDQRL